MMHCPPVLEFHANATVLLAQPDMLTVAVLFSHPPNPYLE